MTILTFDHPTVSSDRAPPSLARPLSCQVAEHVPKVHEAAMLANLDRHNRKGIVMSWSSMRSGALSFIPPLVCPLLHTSLGAQ